MGMEAEIRRRVTDDDETVLAGDTRLLSHPWFRLVSDKMSAADGQYSNMEFVLKRFDQKTPAQAGALASLNERLDAMESVWTQLYATTGTLRVVVPPTQGAHTLMYYNVPAYGDTEDLLVAECPDDDDEGEMYVHYTVGFTPLEWHRMLTGISGVVVDDDEVSRAKTHLTNGLAVAATITDGLTDEIRALEDQPHAASLVREELVGHLALLYMHTVVWVERTLEKQLEELEDADDRDEDKIEAVNQQLPFGRGQVKNKIAALPRATLSQLYGVLSESAQAVLAAESETVLDAFAAKLEAAHGLDLPEKYILDSPADGSAALDEYIGAGLGNGRRISQKVLFGGMKEVGVDTSIDGLNLIPFEFRGLFTPGVDWAGLKRDARKVMEWSRNPMLEALE